MTTEFADTGNTPLRLLIVDDQPVIRRGLAMILGDDPDIEIVGQAADGIEAIELALSTSPDVVIMDLQMPRASGVVATREITLQRPTTRIIILSTFADDDLVFEAIRAGAHAYLLKDADEKEVLETIRSVRRGESRLSPVIARKVMDQFRALSMTATEVPDFVDVDNLPRPVESSESTHIPITPTTTAGISPDKLSVKEQRILELRSQGKSNKQIADKVFLAEGSAKNYVSRIMDKLHTHNRTELAVRAASRHNKTTSG